MGLARTGVGLGPAGGTGIAFGRAGAACAPSHPCSWRSLPRLPGPAHRCPNPEGRSGPASPSAHQLSPSLSGLSPWSVKSWARR